MTDTFSVGQYLTLLITSFFHPQFSGTFALHVVKLMSATFVSPMRPDRVVGFSATGLCPEKFSLLRGHPIP